MGPDQERSTHGDPPLLQVPSSTIQLGHSEHLNWSHRAFSFDSCGQDGHRWLRRGVGPQCFFVGLL